MRGRAVAETERQLKRTESTGGSAESGEYLKNVVLQLYVLDDGLEKLLPVLATFLQARHGLSHVHGLPCASAPCRHDAGWPCLALLCLAVPCRALP